MADVGYILRLNHQGLVTAWMCDMRNEGQKWATPRVLALERCPPMSYVFLTPIWQNFLTLIQQACDLPRQ